MNLEMQHQTREYITVVMNAVTTPHQNASKANREHKHQLQADTTRPVTKATKFKKSIGCSKHNQ